MRPHGLPIWCVSGALLASLTTFAAAAQDGVIIIARDVPAGYAFLPHGGEALTVKTAPFLDVWGDVAPSGTMSDAATAKVSSDAAPLDAIGSQAGQFDPSRAGDIRARGDFAGSAVPTSGVGALVSGTVNSGMQSLQGGLAQLQTALGQAR